jgi:hypothetical protein
MLNSGWYAPFVDMGLILAGGYVDVYVWWLWHGDVER